jgi:hypothetical protein
VKELAYIPVTRTALCVPQIESPAHRKQNPALALDRRGRLMYKGNA